MTREQATQNIDEIDFLTWQIDIIEDMLDQIFNDHEAQLNAKDEEIKTAKMRHKLEHDRYLINENIIKEKDEAITELEALQQPKSCESCKQCDYCEYLKVKYYENNFDGSATIREVYAKVPNDFCCNRYEAKEQ